MTWTRKEKLKKSFSSFRGSNRFIETLLTDANDLHLHLDRHASCTPREEVQASTQSQFLFLQLRRRLSPSLWDYRDSHSSRGGTVQYVSTMTTILRIVRRRRHTFNAPPPLNKASETCYASRGFSHISKTRENTAALWTVRVARSAVRLAVKYSWDVVPRGSPWRSCRFCCS